MKSEDCIKVDVCKYAYDSGCFDGCDFRIEKNNGRWYKWCEKLPPFDKDVWFCDRNGNVAIDQWSYPDCSNNEYVINCLKSGEWTTYGTNSIGHVMFWGDFEIFTPPKPSLFLEVKCNQKNS